MLIRFIRGTALGGVGNDAAPGDVCELSDAAARGLIAEGRAELAPNAPPAPVSEPQRNKPTRKAKSWTSSATAP